MPQKITLRRRTSRLARLRDRIAAFRACRSGLALLEFAFAFPIVLALGMYGLETANLALAHMRVSNIAMLTADNAARVRESIDETDVIELFTGAKSTGAGLRFAQNGRIILSDMEANPLNTAQWLRWQRCDGALNVPSSFANYAWLIPNPTGAPVNALGVPITDGTEVYLANRTTPSGALGSSHLMSTLLGIGPDSSRISAQPGTAGMVVEVVYNYQPLVSNALFGPITIRYQSAFNVRQRTNQSLTNTSRVTPRACNAFNA